MAESLFQARRPRPPLSRFQCPVCGRMVMTWTHVESCRRAPERFKR